MSMKNNEAKKIRMIVAAAAILVAALMAAYGYATLPAEVATQFQGALNTGAPSVPKLFAVLLPFGIVALFAVRSVTQPKSILICLIGYLMNVFIWLSN